MNASETGFTIVGILFLLFCVAVALAFFIFWVWMLVHALANEGISGSEKVAWVLVILFASLIGSVAYFFVGRPKAANPRPPG